MENLIKYAELFSRLSEGFSGSDLGKKAAQKMFYFFERDGIKLNLRYCIHYYGPYSSRLDNYMHILESEDYIKIDTSGATHIISIGERNKNLNVLTKEENEKVKFVIDNFAKRTPFELEALATMDYISHSIFSDKGSETDIKNKFKEIKGEKFSDKVISTAYEFLKKLNFVT